MIVTPVSSPPLTVYESWQLNLEKGSVAIAWLKAWNETAKRTSTALPIDGLILPPSPNVAHKHGEWPRNIVYTSMFNMIDYPGMVIRVGSEVNPERDPVDSQFKAAIEKDKEIQAMCRFSSERFVMVEVQIWK